MITFMLSHVTFFNALLSLPLPLSLSLSQSFIHLYNILILYICSLQLNIFIFHDLQIFHELWISRSSICPAHGDSRLSFWANMCTAASDLFVHNVSFITPFVKLHLCVCTSFPIGRLSTEESVRVPVKVSERGAGQTTRLFVGPYTLRVIPSHNLNIELSSRPGR